MENLELYLVILNNAFVLATEDSTVVEAGTLDQLESAMVTCKLNKHKVFYSKLSGS